MGGMPAVRMDERLFNLVLALLSTRQGITKADIFAHVRGYTDADAGSSHAWLFWALLCLVLLAVIVVLRIITMRSKRRYPSNRRKRSGYRIYRR